MFGFVPSIQIVAVFGIVLFALLCFQISLGMRWIKIKGRRHWKTHKWVAWTIFGIGLLHGLAGLVVAGIIRLG